MLLFIYGHRSRYMFQGIFLWTQDSFWKNSCMASILFFMFISFSEKFMANMKQITKGNLIHLCSIIFFAISTTTGVYRCPSLLNCFVVLKKIKDEEAPDLFLLPLYSSAPQNTRDYQKRQYETKKSSRVAPHNIFNAHSILYACELFHFKLQVTPGELLFCAHKKRGSNNKIFMRRLHQKKNKTDGGRNGLCGSHFEKKDKE